MCRLLFSNSFFQGMLLCRLMRLRPRPCSSFRVRVLSGLYHYPYFVLHCRSERESLHVFPISLANGQRSEGASGTAELLLVPIASHNATEGGRLLEHLTNTPAWVLHRAWSCMHAVCWPFMQHESSVASAKLTVVARHFTFCLGLGALEARSRSSLGGLDLFLGSAAVLVGLALPYFVDVSGLLVSSLSLVGWFCVSAWLA